MALPESFLQDLRLRNPISDVVSSYVNLKRAGRNMVGLCPFHNEKTPSFTVYTATDSFYCFGCGCGGEVITFIRKIENLDYIDAVKFLAQRCGMQMPEFSVDDSLAKLRIRIFEANRAAAKFFNNYLYSPGGKKGLDYLKNRGLSDSTIKHFGLGFAPENTYELNKYLINNGFTEFELEQANLAFKSSRTNRLVDRFIDRVIYPMIDLRGNVIAFAGRTLNKTDKAKYINTSDTPVFKKSENLFALNYAKNTKEKQIILVEGYMDVISLHQAGIENTVACMGTSLTKEHAQLLSRYCEEVVLCFDSDNAGSKATQRSIEILRQANIPIRIIRIPGNKDPDEFLNADKATGVERFKALIEKSRNDIEYKLSLLRQGVDLSEPSAKVSFLTEAAKIIAGIDNSVEADVYCGKLCKELEVEKASMLQLVNKYRSKYRSDAKRKQLRFIQTEDTRPDSLNPDRNKRLKAAKAEESLITYIFGNPDKIGEISKRISADDFVTEFNGRIFACISEKLLNGGTISLTEIAGKFSVEENSRIAFMANRLPGDLASANECIDIILSEKKKQNLSSTPNAGDDDILNYINSIKKGKQ
ncbi:MAG: DNA primase [Clostridiales bacterium]|nr:DNA primase [Clostridiales bacterium]